MKIVVLEDNSLEYKKLKDSLMEWLGDYDIELNIVHYTSGETFFENESIFEQIDLFLLDIEMGQMNGIDVAKRLRNLNYKGDIIFLTAFRDFVFEGYNVHAFNYLVKPIEKELLFKCLTEIESKRHSNKYTYRNKEQNVIAIPYPDIISFSVNRHYIDISTIDNTYCQYGNLNSIINQLPRQFVQVHRSCIVNLAHVYKISQNVIHLSNGTTIEIGKTYLKNFKNQFLQYTTRFNRKGEFV